MADKPRRSGCTLLLHLRICVCVVVVVCHTLCCGLVDVASWANRSVHVNLSTAAVVPMEAPVVSAAVLFRPSWCLGR